MSRGDDSQFAPLTQPPGHGRDLLLGGSPGSFVPLTLGIASATRKNPRLPRLTSIGRRSSRTFSSTAIDFRSEGADEPGAALSRQLAELFLEASGIGAVLRTGIIRAAEKCAPAAFA